MHKFVKSFLYISLGDLCECISPYIYKYKYIYIWRYVPLNWFFFSSEHFYFFFSLVVDRFIFNSEQLTELQRKIMSVKVLQYTHIALPPGCLIILIRHHPKANRVAQKQWWKESGNSLMQCPYSNACLNAFLGLLR